MGSRRSTARSRRGQSQTTGATERDRLVAGATKALLDLGHEDIGVEDIVRNAGLSEDVFQAHFSSREQCILAAFDSFVEGLRAEAVAECEAHADEDWTIQVRVGLDAVLGQLAEVPRLARMFALWTPTMAGPAATERILRSVDRFAVLLRAGRERLPQTSSLPAATEHNLVGGVVFSVSTYLLAEQAEVLPELLPELVEFVLTPYVGREQAQRVGRGG